jgi:transcriptional regulator with XRE-family HTH domain
MNESTTLTGGERIQLYRERAGKTRAVVGGLVGRSGEWVKSVEKGRILPPRLPMLDKLAGALKVQVADLLGDEGPELQRIAGTVHAALPVVRDALTEYVLVLDDAPPPDLDLLSDRVAAAWRARHSSPDHRTVLAGLLPGLIRDTRNAARRLDGAERRRANALVADVLGLTQMYVAYQPAAELLWRVADRAMVAAQDAADPHAIAGAAWFLVEALRDSGDWDTATAVNLDALRLVEPYIADGGVDLMAMWGSLQTVAALTYARAGEDGRAWQHWDQAERMARRLPAGYTHRWTWFSRPVVGFYAVSLAVELQKGGEALRQAGRVDPDTITSTPRRARHLIEVARGHRLSGDVSATMATLNSAYRTAPETIRYNGYARQMTIEALTSTNRAEAQDLATRLGVL